MMRSSFVDVDGTRLHVVSGGDGPTVLFLHGFPEFWYAWRRQLPAVAATHRVIAVDLPGVNLSDKPTDPSAYRLDRVGDLVAGLIRRVAPDQKVSLVGHDLGGMIAWDVAARHPELVDRLIAINAPPAAVLAREIASDPAQRRASGYIPALQAPGAEVGLAANGYARLLATMTDNARPSTFSQADRDAWVQAWSRPGAVAGMIGYYRAWDADPTPSPVVRAPTLVIWGDADPFLLPGCLDGLDAFAKDVRIHRISGATHGVVHEEPERVTEAIRRFVSPATLDRPVFDVLAERETWRRHADYGCFVTSPDNPRGLRLTPRVDPGRVWVHTRFDRDQSGIIGLAHCGLVFTVLEALMGWLVTSHVGRLGLTTKASIENLAPVHVGVDYELVATADPDVPNTSTRVHVMSRIFAVGEPDRPCAIARAQFHLPTRERAEALLGRPIDVSPQLFR